MCGVKRGGIKDQDYRPRMAYFFYQVEGEREGLWVKEVSGGEGRSV